MSIFNKVQAPSLEKYDYNVSHEFKFSNNFGNLSPIGFHEVLPGDTFKLSSEIFMRMAPLVHPIMQRMNIDVHHFFVPYRIIWDQFQEFITGFSDDATPTSIKKVPQILFENLNENDPIVQPNSLPHFFGFPLYVFLTENENDYVTCSALPFRAYQQIYNDYYRDPLKQSKVIFDKGSNDLGWDDDTTEEVNQLLQVRQRCYPRDYFTSSLPDPQLGDPAVLPSPLIDYARKIGQNIPASGALTTSLGALRDSANNVQLSAISGEYQTTDGPFTINKLKELFSLQKLFDVGNKFGSRYVEQTLGHFGVRSSDGRVQRAQYLGGGRIPVQISQVSQLSSSTADSPLGYQGGQGMAAGADNYFEHTFEEHGLIISILSVVPEPNYTDGIHKFMIKQDRFDFAFPELSNIGEQEVNSFEWCIANAPGTFGYQERYAEYKSNYNRVAGDFLTSLRNFYVAPNQVLLSDCTDEDTFVVKPDTLQNIFAVTDPSVDKFYFQVYHNIYKSTVIPYLNRNINPTSFI